MPILSRAGGYYKRRSLRERARRRKRRRVAAVTVARATPGDAPHECGGYRALRNIRRLGGRALAAVFCRSIEVVEDRGIAARDFADEVPL